MQQTILGPLALQVKETREETARKELPLVVLVAAAARARLAAMPPVVPLVLVAQGSHLLLPEVALPMQEAAAVARKVVSLALAAQAGAQLEP